jgi:hypothetical protein
LSNDHAIIPLQVCQNLFCGLMWVGHCCRSLRCHGKACVDR